MSPVADYFKTTYRFRLKTLRTQVLNRRPVPPASEEDIAEYSGWLQKELDFFHHGTYGALKDQVGQLENLIDKRHKLMVSVEFVSNYLLFKVTEEQLDKLLIDKKMH